MSAAKPDEEELRSLVRRLSSSTWGRARASGVYLYRLQAGGQVAPRRLLVLK